MNYRLKGSFDLMRWRGSVILFLVFLFSCKLGADYERPEITNNQAYRQSLPSGENIANTPWWKLFEDSILTSLIQQSLDNNQDLATAVARMDEASAAIGIVRADLYPRVNYFGTGSSTFNSQNTGATNQVYAGAGISYQVDLWGKYRRLSSAAFQDYLATEEAYRALTILLVSEVASTYMLLRDLDNRLVISEKTTETWLDNYTIVSARFNAGFVSEVDVNQALIQLTEAQTAIQTFIRLRTQTENALSTLMGVPPQDIPRGKMLMEQVLPPETPIGLPSELLDRRPDVLLSERQLNAQTERLGASEALKYPSLTLSADLAYSFTNPNFGAASLGGDILGPIFNNKANKRRIEIEKARTEQLLNNYEKVYINAIREVEDAMIAVKTYKEEYDLRNKQVNAAQNAAKLSWVRYDGGLTSYLEVLDLQRSSFSTQLKVSETLQLQLNSIIRLYQALGGGWVAEQDSILRTQ